MCRPTEGRPPRSGRARDDLLTPPGRARQLCGVSAGSGSGKWEVRTAHPAELDEVYMMGYDAWAGDLEKTHYVEHCRCSEHYRRGIWYVLTAGELTPASLIVYREAFRLPIGCYGVGSVATIPAHRRQGYGSALVAEVTRRLGDAGARGVFLFSEVGERFYADLGYRRTGNDLNARGGVCMVHSFEDPAPFLGYCPDYF